MRLRRFAKIAYVVSKYRLDQLIAKISYPWLCEHY